MRANAFDVVVVGAGLSGLTAAAAAASDRSQRVALVTTGPGSFVFGSGLLKTQDVCDQSSASQLDEGIAFFCDVARDSGCPFAGELSAVHHLPTLMGELQSVALAPLTVWEGGPHDTPTAIVGIEGLSSFDSNFLAQRLNDSADQIGYRDTYVSRQLSLPRDFGAVTLLRMAQQFDRDASFRSMLSEALLQAADGFERILVPGMLGLYSDVQLRMEFESHVGRVVSEMSTLPPSIPTLRVFHRLMNHLQKIGVELYQGFPVSKLQIQAGTCTALHIDSPGHPMVLQCERVVLAIGQYSANILGSAVASHDEQMHPLDSGGKLFAQNLFVAGSLSHRGFGGNVAEIVTGYRAGMAAAAEEVCFAKR